MINSVSHDSVSCLVADRPMCFATALDKAFENIDCMSAILRCQAKNHIYESTQRLIQPRRVLCGEGRRGADEQIRRNPPRLHQLKMYPLLCVYVETYSGQVLQAQVAIRVDRGALQLRRKIGTAAGITRQQINRRYKTDIAQGFGGARVVDAIESLHYLIDSDRRGIDLAEQHHVAAGVSVVDPNECDACSMSI